MEILRYYSGIDCSTIRQGMRLEVTQMIRDRVIRSGEIAIEE